MTTQEKIDDMFARYEKIEAGGGAKRVGKQHDSGKMTARERIAAFWMKAVSWNWINS